MGDPLDETWATIPRDEDPLPPGRDALADAIFTPLGMVAVASLTGFVTLMALLIAGTFNIVG